MSESEDNSETEEWWHCGDCSHSESAPVGELAGEHYTKTVGSGHREKQIETVRCPNCQSEDWHSDSARMVLGTANKAVSEHGEGVGN